jgi:muconolactone delta-isomerase
MSEQDMNSELQQSCSAHHAWRVQSHHENFGVSTHAVSTRLSLQHANRQGKHTPAHAVK